jgi:hypothetical protein
LIARSATYFPSSIQGPPEGFLEALFFRCFSVVRRRAFEGAHDLNGAVVDVLANQIVVVPEGAPKTAPAMLVTKAPFRSWCSRVRVNSTEMVRFAPIVAPAPAACPSDALIEACFV